LVLVNIVSIVSFIKFVVSIKHLILISSLQLFILFLCGMNFDDQIFLVCYNVYYSVVIMMILVYIIGYVSVALFIVDLCNIKQYIVVSLVIMIVY
jgi:hypothetical protein